MRLKYKLGLGIIVVALVICFMTYQSYALWIVNHTGKENVVEVGCFTINYEEISSPITLNNTYPVSDTKGLSTIPYTFKVKNNCSIDSSYVVTLNTLTTNTIPKENIKFAIYKEGEAKPTSGINLQEHSETHQNTDLKELNVKDLEESIILREGALKQNEEATYNVHLWLDETTGNEAMGQRFESSIDIISRATSIAPKTAIDKITELAATSSEIVDDGTSDHNIRYIGVDPKNYVTLGDTYQTDIYDVPIYNGYAGLNASSIEECDNLKIDAGIAEDAVCEKVHDQGEPILWRIIGVMNNIDDGTGKKESRVKLMKNDSIGPWIWDSSPTEINGGYGVNEWSQADVKTVLNDYYYNSLDNQTCYIASDDRSTTCSFINTGLSTSAKSFIADAVWNTGATDSGETGYSITSIDLNRFYELERGNRTGKLCTIGDYCNDTVERTTTWTGKIGLIYPSDYIYATDGGSTGRDTCLLDQNIEYWIFADDCRTNNWINGLAIQRLAILTMMPIEDSAHDTVAIGKDLFVETSGNDLFPQVFPSVYLKSNVKISSGEGTATNPYVLIS